jgi:hypothetical protein
MLPGEAPPGRGPPPGRGGMPPGPGRGPAGPCGRGIGRSTGCAEENGLLPTRGGRGTPGLGAAGPGRGPVAGAATGGAGGTGGTGGAIGAAGAAGTGAVGLATGGAVASAPASATASTGAGLAAGAFAGAFFGASAALAPPKDSRNRRATGASTVEDADLTNSPCSLRRARTSLLVTPSSLANSCTRALPATTSPSLEATAVGRPRLGFSYDAWSSGLHGVLMFFATCSLPGGANIAKCSTTAAVSGVPAIRNARPKARLRTAADRHRSSGCNQAPRPGREPAVSTATAQCPFPIDTATTRSSSTANSRFRQPIHIRTGVRRASAARLSRWITGQSTSPLGGREPLGWRAPTWTLGCPG